MIKPFREGKERGMIKIGSNPPPPCPKPPPPPNPPKAKVIRVEIVLPK